ncbi:IS3 family transposase [Pedobacter immunditicola]|uniref:IS3 family transposase n=1 Tax=Pedobacter immunditicola TaxID=3133440 RepID=UPI0030A10383
MIQRMSRKGNCLDNALAESFFGIVKTELLYTQSFETAEEFIASLKEYIDYYNNKKNKKQVKWKEPGEIPNSCTKKLNLIICPTIRGHTICP